MMNPSKLEDQTEASEDFVGLAPPDLKDPLIEVFKKNVDRTLLIQNLRMTVDQRARQMQKTIASCDKFRGLAWRQHGKSSLS